MLPFTLSFLDDVVPDNYRLPVTVSVSGGDAAAPTIYRPLYKDWEIQKFVNSNRLDAFGKDGAEVVVTPQEEGGNPYLDDLTYVDFAFIVNKYTNDQCSLADLRDARSVTLTDTLPTYTDRNGVSRIAVFDADQNPGWTLSEDGKTVSRTYTLSRIGDPNLFGASGRGSEFPVRLRGAITPPEGYTVYYTTSDAVYTHSMEEMVDSDIWTTSVTDYASVTAFKLVAGEGTELAGNSRFQVRIPVCAPKTFDEDSMDLLHAKVDLDQASGTVSWLQAVNAFGFRTVQTPTVKESNTVWARVCFAGFCVKKVNGATQAALPGAEFTLTDAAGTIVGTAVSDADGRLQFRELTEGAYTLAETKVPDGFLDTHISVAVTITQNPVTLAYSVTFSGDHTGLGASADPLCIENHGAYVLPKTGGRGTAAFYVPGAFLLLSAAALPDLRKRRSRKRCGSIPVQPTTPPALLRRRRFSAKCRVCLYLLAKFSCICYTFYWKNVQEARHGSVSYH